MEGSGLASKFASPLKEPTRDEPFKSIDADDPFEATDALPPKLMPAKTEEKKKRKDDQAQDHCEPHMVYLPRKEPACGEEKCYSVAVSLWKLSSKTPYQQHEVQFVGGKTDLTFRHKDSRPALLRQLNALHLFCLSQEVLSRSRES